MSKILSLATAALKPGQLEDQHHRQFPRVDYVELQKYLPVEVFDYDSYPRPPAGSFLRRIETQVRSDLYLALLGFMHRPDYKLVFAWSERAGIPYAGLRRLVRDDRPFAAMFTCWSKRQEQAVTSLKLFDAMDTIAVHCDSMKRNFVRLGAPESKVHVIHYSVDQHFFSPIPDVKQQPGLVLSLGETRSRDYASLMSAVDGLPAQLLIAASGSWYAREKNNELTTTLPDNVTLLDRLSLAELKQLYARSQFLVLPLLDQVYSAGATASLEAMGMGRAVVAFRSEGIVDFIKDGETGLLVEPGNTQALRDAIQYLLENPQEAQRMGENGRQRVKEELNLDNYVRGIVEWLETCL